MEEGSLNIEIKLHEKKKYFFIPFACLVYSSECCFQGWQSESAIWNPESAVNNLSGIRIRNFSEDSYKNPKPICFADCHPCFLYESCFKI